MGDVFVSIFFLSPERRTEVKFQIREFKRGKFVPCHEFVQRKKLIEVKFVLVFYV